MQSDQSANTSTHAPTASQEPSRKPLPKKFFIIGGVLILFIIAIIALVLMRDTNSPQDTKEQATTSKQTPGFEDIKKTAADSPNAKAESNLLVYGAWTGQSSLIKAIDIATGDSQLLATLSMNVKKVSIIDEQTILYIDQIDKKDHGKTVTVYDIKTKKVLASIPAATGFGIDEYTLSPDKKYLALWEVSFAQGAEVLQGGKSRVYSVDLSKPTIKNLLYDETATNPVHYPRAILNNGTVFADSFMPNDPNGGAGWAYGMSISSFDGTTKKDIENMKAGTYGTQPSLSQDGKYLLVAGYDGKYGDGTAIKNGIRQAILTPNTVDLVDTQTLQRYKLANLPNTDSYPSAHWDSITGKILLSVVGASADRTGLYAYDITSKSLEEITVPAINNNEYMLVSNLAGNQMLVGTFEEKASNVGNLGANYEYAYSGLASFDQKTSKSKPIVLEDSYAQYITLLPAGYFKNVLGVKTIAQANPQPTFIDQYSNQNDTKQRLQLYTFFLKYDLQPIRLKQQSTPITANITPHQSISIPPNHQNLPPINNDDNLEKCNDVTARVCAEKGQGPGTKDYVMCKGMYKAQNMERTCDDSPLYLYGTMGQKVKVTINTPVFNAIPSYNNGYDVTLLADGKMQINNAIYNSIAYDYSSNLRRTQAPKTGAIVARDQVANVLRDYAQKLGLNEKETVDLITAGKQKITTPYAFVSFFDHETSQQILPLSFNPQPDNYLNVVFYFKLLDKKPNFTAVPPTFPNPIQRSGFTAIEVSEMVE